MKKHQFQILIVFFITVFINFSCRKNDSYLNSINEEQIELIRNEVTVEVATTLATNFLNQRSRLKSALSVKQTKEIKLPVKDRKLFVVQFEPHGYVVTSDNMLNIPVLAFSEDGTFDFNNFNEFPVGMKEWMSETILMNFELEKDTLLQKANRIRSRWENYLPKLKSSAVLDPNECTETYIYHTQDIYDDCIVPTHWSQGLPYNLYTPVCYATGAHMPAGCVAVAMAQIMNYWEYPSGFNWSILHDTYFTSDTTSSSAVEVANLLEDIGDNINMDYGCDESGATMNKAKNALDDDYGYSGAISHVNWNINDIRSNIKSGYPVILGGYRTSTTVLGVTWYTHGHSWVCDGLWEEWDNYEKSCPSPRGPVISYTSDNFIYYLHMNWGWGHDYQNVWYYSNELTHPIGTDRDYKWNRDMIKNIHP